MKKPGSLSMALATATSSLLPAAAPLLAAEPWAVDAEILIYNESAGRVSDNSFKSIARREWGDEGSFTVGVQLDSLTGASPSGAIPLDEAQTITQASGNNSTIAEAGELPLDATFEDGRAALTASVTNALDSGYRYSAGASFSNEFDYVHLGLNASLAQDFNNNNTTVSAGFAIASDTVSPVGGIPDPLSFQRGAGVQLNRSADKSKSVVDGLFGLTQIINRRSLVQLNYSISLSDGYLTDPYKILTVLNSDGDPVDSIQDDIFQYRFESRPDSKLGQNLYIEYKYRFDAGIFSGSFRYHTNDWGIASQTIESRFRWLMSDKHYLEPHFRFYSQSAANFYKTWLAEGEIPEFASSDYRLGDFTGLTLGMNYTRHINTSSSIGATLETYQSTGSASQAPAENNGSRSVAYPDLTATMFRLRYRFNW